MFSGIRIFSSDATWRQILADLNAVLVDTPDAIGLNFDALKLDLPISIPELRATVLAAVDYSRVVADIVGENVNLSPLQGKIIALMHKSGGMTVADMKTALGYAPDATTHAVDTAIYGLRKLCGYEFIQNVGGIYKIGRI